MRNKSASKIQLGGLDELLKATQINPEDVEGKIVQIPVDSLREYHDHPYKVIQDSKMEELIDSVSDFGILTPILVRKIEKTNTFEIISGHRRTHAAKTLGLENVPALVLQLDDDAADIAMVNANLQREQLLPSEKARAYRKKYVAMKHQGQTGGRSLKKMEEDTGESQMTIHRYMRLNELTGELLDLVDKGKLGFIQGVNLSFLSKDQQQRVFEALKENGCKMTKEQSAQLKAYAEEGKLTEFSAGYLISGITKRNYRPLKIKRETLLDFFEVDVDDQTIEEVIISLLTEWKKGKGENK